MITLESLTKVQSILSDLDYLYIRTKSESIPLDHRDRCTLLGAEIILNDLKDQKEGSEVVEFIQSRMRTIKSKYIEKI